jgi:hypothetical protein
LTPQQTAGESRPFAFISNRTHDWIAMINKTNLPQSFPEVSIDDLDPASLALLQHAEALSKEHRKRPKGKRRRWSEEGTVCAELLMLAMFDEALQRALENHAYNHRLCRAFPCSPRCRARDLWGALRLSVKQIGPPKDWPIRPLLARLLKEVTGYIIEQPVDFDRDVNRDLAQLPTAHAVPKRQRSATQKRLLATYNVTIDLLITSQQHPFIGAGDIDKN